MANTEALQTQITAAIQAARDAWRQVGKVTPGEPDLLTAHEVGSTIEAVASGTIRVFGRHDPRQEHVTVTIRVKAVT